MTLFMKAALRHLKLNAAFFVSVMALLASAASQGSATANAADAAGGGLFARTNLVAWCIVPFDAKKRGPEERAAMLERLGFRLFAYDYRAEHIPTFDAELEALKRHNVRLLAWWFPTTLNDEARSILAVLKRRGIQAQLWVMGDGESQQSREESTE